MQNLKKTQKRIKQFSVVYIFTGVFPIVTKIITFEAPF
jgi:hypothetical protein